MVDKFLLSIREHSSSYVPKTTSTTTIVKEGPQNDECKGGTKAHNTVQNDGNLASNIPTHVSSGHNSKAAPVSFNSSPNKLTMEEGKVSTALQPSTESVAAEQTPSVENAMQSAKTPPIAVAPEASDATCAGSYHESSPSLKEALISKQSAETVVTMDKVHDSQNSGSKGSSSMGNNIKIDQLLNGTQENQSRQSLQSLHVENSLNAHCSKTDEGLGTPIPNMILFCDEDEE